MPKAWLKERWELLVPLVEELTVDDEDAIAQICLEEIATWKARPTMKSISSLKEPMSDTRNRIRALPLRDANSYLNTRTGKREHIVLKYLNYSEGEWAEMNAPSEATFEYRQEHRLFIDHPDAVVQKAAELLKSKKWYDIAVGLAVTTGRRLTEVLKVGKFTPTSTAYTLEFSGQLKRKDEILAPYEIPTLVEADLVLHVWERLRTLLDCSAIEKEQISTKYGPMVVDAANRHFEGLVPPREDGDLYTHLFRAVYGRIAAHYFAEPRLSDLRYMAVIYGHYWLIKATGKQLENYASTMHYTDYLIGDGKGNIDGRMGIRLGEPGVELLARFKENAVETTSVETPSEGHMVVEKEVELLHLEEKKGHSITRMDQTTKSRIDKVQKEQKLRTQDEALSLVLDDHYILQQIIQLVKPLYEDLEVETPVAAVRALLGEGGAIQVDRRLMERWQASLSEMEELLEVASERAGEDVPYQNEYARAQAVVKGELSNGEKELTPLQSLLQDTLAEHEELSAKAPVLYLRGLVNAKAVARKAYAKRHEGKDYSTIPTSKLRNTKMPGAAEERFKRAVNAIMRHNETVTIPEWRRYVSPALVNDLVGGRPAEIKTYIESRPDVVAHHEKYGLRPGINRIPLVSVKLEVPELPEGVKAGLSEDEPSEEEEVTAEE